MNDQLNKAVGAKIQRMHGERVFDIPREFEFDADEVMLEYDGERIVMTPTEPEVGAGAGEKNV